MTAPGHLTHTGSEGVWFTTRKDRIAGYTPANPAPFKYDKGQSVTVIKPGIHEGMVGVVSNRWQGTPHRYTVYIHIPGVLTPIFPFTENELKATDVRPMVIPKKKSDRFMCAWGVFDLDQHPNIALRWAERHQPTAPVIQLEAQSKSTRQEQAHQRFVKFLGYLRLTDALNDFTPEPKIERGILDIVMEQEAAKQNVPAIAKKQPKFQNRRNSRKTSGNGTKQRQAPKILDYPKMRVRRVAGL